jgi:cytochrome c oxidase subunit 2
MMGFPASWASEASAHAHQVDLLFASAAALTLALAAPAFLLSIVFAVKYRRGKPANRRHPPNRIVWLEVSWALVPFLVLIALYAWSAHLFVDLHEPPANALVIDVVAKQWMWKFQHPGGQAEINELHVPIGQPVKLVMASEDVVHSLFIPALRIKQDVVPGRYTSMWFTADRPGRYRLTCSQFCGTDHAIMGGYFIAMRPEDYAHWLDRPSVDDSLAAQGARLFRSRGCSGCHGPSATVHAPPLEGLFGGPVPLQNGQIVTADEQYIRDSILLPQKQIAAGYPPIMPTFQNVLSEDEVLKLVAYVESLGGQRPKSQHPGNGQP